jgi:NitT/TauT family transport system substrate-binding protein
MLKHLKTTLILAIIALTGLAGCSTQSEPPIKLITNSWIGFTPLFYAKEKGWLKPLNIELSTVVSLGESMMTYKIGHFNGITGTQYEFQQLHKQHPDLVPLIMFDRSNGGDMVMSNRNIDALKQTSETIDVYLEVNSINSLIFKNFIDAHQLDSKSFNFINRDPLRIVTHIKQIANTQPTIIVTYNPYNFELSKHGFNTIASSKNLEEILVVDALYIKKRCITEHKEQLIKLKKVIDLALQDLQKTPHDYYEKVKPYLENTTYEDFLASLQQIEWLNLERSDALIKKLNSIAFPTRDLL